MPLATLASTGPPRLPLPSRKRWTVAEFHQLRSATWLESRRLILVEGEILEMPNPSPPHDSSLGLTEEALRAAFGRGFWVRGQMALVLGLATDPVPDLVVVPGGPRDYAEHPRSALLVVEIAESSLAYDCGDKADLYAAGGLREYWVVDLAHRQVIVHRDPVGDAVRLHGAKYQSITVVGADGTLASISLSGRTIAVRDLLP
ncbi:MAG: Uma2 family endonuclease [Planctomycetes bacterium]|nr:Uma2 family endonuclease [Planctomycetota bacterium]